jgi:hypothetical protein
MNYWKPIALISVASLVVSAAYHVAQANPGPAPGSVGGAQPHMAAALNALNTAMSELKAAEHNKGGWRDSAMRNTKSAIDDVMAGINFADRH